jgi:hypothetical protein
MLADTLCTTDPWAIDSSPLILGEICSADKSIAIWQRGTDTHIQRYFKHAFSSLGLGVRGVFSLQSMKKELERVLPSTSGQKDVIDDIYLLADMLTCLFSCDNVGLRLVPLTNAMCPKFHTDHIPVRMICTYMGPATEWLPSSHADPKTDVQQMAKFDVALLKGSAWEGHNGMAITHRSCQLEGMQQRVLLTLDPM